MDEKHEARAFLAGTELDFDDADKLWKALRRLDEISLARRVLGRIRSGHGLTTKAPKDLATKRRLCQQEALLTSKDQELSASFRHDRALDMLAEHFGDLGAAALDGDGETLGIAGGIAKRRWNDLGQIGDLRKAADFYQRGAKGDPGDDAYALINAAFAEDLLAGVGDDAVARRQEANRLRTQVLAQLPAPDKVPPHSLWFNAASRAEALFGLKRYAEATAVIAGCERRPEPWELETTSRQLASIAHMHEQSPLAVPQIRAFFDVLLKQSAGAVASAMTGKVGLALSGGGFRAAFYHLGLLARLAELDMLRRVDVLSCVSGGSIVGTCYWLALRARLLDPKPLTRDDYVDLVKRVIGHFLDAVATDLRRDVQPSRAAAIWGLLRGEQGVLDPELAAKALEERFYRPLLPGSASRPFMHDLPFTPADHDAELTHAKEFHPGRHNWLREHKVPVLVINATTVNTAHAWQFTPTWMGESPWAIHESADSISRLEWSWYEPARNWSIELGRAVAASACVPGAFRPLEIAAAYPGLRVQLVDGGVHDNQGVVSLLAHNCNVLLVSDACGQLLLKEVPGDGLTGLADYARRSMDMLMERVRLASFGDLLSRRRSGLLRGLMFLHMKAGLDADPIRLPFSVESYDLQRSPLSPSGVRKDFQKALAELRTDLDAFTPDESHALMACGYRMCHWGVRRYLMALKNEVSSPAREVTWPFDAMLEEITSTKATTPRRDEILADLRRGTEVRLARKA